MQELLDLLRRSRAGIRLCAGPLNDRGCDLRQVRFGNAPVSEPAELAERRELLDADAELAAEAADGVRNHLLVEGECLWERQRVHRAVGQAVAATERLGDRVAERE